MLAVLPLLAAAEGGILLPLAGVGVLFGALGMSLIMGGAIGELIYATGNIDLSEYARLLSVERFNSVQAGPQAVSSLRIGE